MASQNFPSNSQTSDNTTNTTSSSSSLSDRLSPFSGNSTILDSEHTLINDEDTYCHNYNQHQQQHSLLQQQPPHSNLGVIRRPGFSLPPLNSRENSQQPKTSEGSSILEDLPVCEEHHLYKDLFCFDCIYEVCGECIKQQHQEHYLYPGVSCKELFEETEKARMLVRENIAIVEKQLNTLHYRKLIASGNIKTYFQRIRELIDNRELELLNDVAYIVDCRGKILEQKLKENREAMSDSNKVMDHLVKNVKSGEYEYVFKNSRYAKKQLEVLRGLHRNLQNQEEDVVFCPPEDAFVMRLKEMGTIVCPSYVASFTCSNIRGNGSGLTNNMTTAAAVTTANNIATAAATAAAMFNNQPIAFNRNHNTLFDNSPQYNPFQTFGPPPLPRSPVTRLPPMPPSLTGIANSIAPDNSNFSLLPFMGKPLRNDTVPTLSPISTTITAATAADNATTAAAAGMFPVSFHTRRNYARIKKPVTVFGKEGSGDYDLCRPWGVCCDNNGHVIIADRSNNRIQIFRSDGSHVRNFGKQGSEEGEFNRPAGVAIDYYGRIVVTDKDNHRIQVFTMEGKFVFAFGERGQANGKFHYPWDVDVNSSGLIAVSDTRNHRVQLFTGNGMFIKKFGFENMSNMWKFFDSPRGLCFSPENTIMVTDFNNHRLYEIDIEKTPKLLHSDNYKKCELFRPQGLAMDAEGNILVSDCRNNRIQVYLPFFFILFFITKKYVL